MPKKKKEQSQDQENGAEEKETEKYADAEVVEQMALRLVPTYHPELATAKMKFVFKLKTSMKNGRPVLGAARRVSGVWYYLTSFDFMIEVAYDEWMNAHSEQREALVDHLLERCTGEEDSENGGAMKWKLREPDVHEFSSIISRRGAWNPDLQSFCNVIQQGVDIPGLVSSVESGDDILQHS